MSDKKREILIAKLEFIYRGKDASEVIPSVISKVALVDIRALYHSMSSLTTEVHIQQLNISSKVSSYLGATTG